MSIDQNNQNQLRQKDIKIVNMASPKALAGIMENMAISKPQLILTEADSNAMIDKLAAAVKFKDINGDQDNSFNEGSDDENIKLDDNGNYVGKGKTTIFHKDVDLKDPSKTKEQWMETSTGRVSDAKTEEVPTLQGEKTATLNENEAMDFSDHNPHATMGETAEEPSNPKLKGPNIEDHRNMKSPLNQPKPTAQNVLSGLLRTPTNGGL